MSSKGSTKREKPKEKARTKRERPQAEEDEEKELAPRSPKRAHVEESVLTKVKAFKTRMLMCRTRVMSTALTPALQNLQNAETYALIQAGSNPVASKRIREQYARLVLQICAAHQLELDKIRHTETVAELLDVLKTALEEMQSAAVALGNFIPRVPPTLCAEEYQCLVMAGQYIQKYTNCLTETIGL